jgi:hypothetical protein
VSTAKNESAAFLHLLARSCTNGHEVVARMHAAQQERQGRVASTGRTNVLNARDAFTLGVTLTDVCSDAAWM